MMEEFFKKHPELSLRLQYYNPGHFWVIEIYSATYYSTQCPLYVYRITDKELSDLNIDFQTAIMTSINNWWNEIIKNMEKMRLQRMIFVINYLKYDTDKMELVSTKCEYTNRITGKGRNVQIFKSLKNRWLLTYETSNEFCAVALSEDEVKKYLISYDWEAYEKYFGELEEA